jgi:hypothetical protein
MYCVWETTDSRDVTLVVSLLITKEVKVITFYISKFGAGATKPRTGGGDSFNQQVI